MSEFKIEVVRIGAIQKHDNADALEMTEVLGCPVIIRKGQFKEGDLAVYVPVNAMVPVDLPEFAFLKGDRPTERIRAKKLRGVFSMGLLVEAPVGAPEGTDLATTWGVTKYVEPAPAFYSFGGKQVRAPALPMSPPTYDIEDLRKLVRGGVHAWEGRECIAHEKIHGCNARFVVDLNGEFRVGTRTTWREHDGENPWSKAAKAYGIEEACRTLGPLRIIYGEVFGPGLQDLTYGIKQGEVGFRAFDVFDAENGRMWSPHDTDIALNAVGIPTAPMIHCGPFHWKLALEYAEKDSTFGGIMEGLVIRLLDVPDCREPGRETIRKLVSQRYHLRKGGTEHQ